MAYADLKQAFVADMKAANKAAALSFWAGVGAKTVKNGQRVNTANTFAESRRQRFHVVK
jgi:hypothetical protein